MDLLLLIDALRGTREVDQHRLASILMSLVPKPRTQEHHFEEEPLLSPELRAEIASLSMVELEVLTECMTAIRSELESAIRLRMN